MRSRFVLSPDQGFLASKRPGLGSRVAGAVVFCLVGAVAATQLYPQMFANRHSGLSATEAGRAAASPAPAAAISERPGGTAAFSPRAEAQYTGGPIPGFNSLPTQIEPAAVNEGAASPDDDKSAAPKSAEKSHHAKNRSTRSYSYNYGYSYSRHGKGKAQDRPYRQSPSTWVAGNSWNSWGSNSWGGNSWGSSGRGQQFARQSDFWR
jgi:hypothetical protein